MKPRLDIDYIAAPRPRRAIGIAVLALALVIAGLLVERYREAKLELERIEMRQGLLSADRRPARVATRERLSEEAKSVEAVLRQLALPWGAIIQSVENAATSDVAVLQMQPDAQQRQLRLGAEARNQAAMVEYVRRLAAAKGLAEVHVASHHVQMEHPQRPVQFTVQALLRGPQ